MAARHYALDVMQVGNKRLRMCWERFSAIVEDRNNMFELSVVFHDWQQKVRQTDCCLCVLFPSLCTPVEDFSTSYHSYFVQPY